MSRVHPPTLRLAVDDAADPHVEKVVSANVESGLAKLVADHLCAWWGAFGAAARAAARAGDDAPLGAGVGMGLVMCVQGCSILC